MDIHSSGLGKGSKHTKGWGEKKHADIIRRYKTWATVHSKPLLQATN